MPADHVAPAVPPGGVGEALFQGRQRKAILVVDMVESVRLIARDEAGITRRWTQFTHHVRGQILPDLSGYLVKSLGDGMMLTFDVPRHAVAAAVAMRAAMGRMNGAAAQAAPASESIALRAGIDCGEVVADDVDIYGHHANLAARIATLAGPDEIVISADLRDQLTDGLDGDFEDLGECYVKHLDAPLRVYRVGAAGPRPALAAVAQYAAALVPTLAVIPFSARSASPEHAAIGELIAECVISQLGRSADLRVISRLSATAFRDRDDALEQVGAHLGASYVVTGSYFASDAGLLVTVALTDTRTAQVLWSDRIGSSVPDLLDLQGQLVHTIAAMVHQRVLRSEVQRSLTMPLPRLDSCALMLGAIALMHRLSRADFGRSRTMLEHLLERHPRYVQPRAWLGRWSNLAIAQGWSQDPRKDHATAMRLLAEALDFDPVNAMALASRGLIAGYIEKRFDLAQDCYDTALAANPNEALAWLGKATLSAWIGDARQAGAAAEMALALSPLDPLKYYFDSLAAVAMLAAGDYARAISLASRSLRMNRSLSATYKTLAEAQFLSDQPDAARQTVRELLRVEPGFTVERFKQVSPLYQGPQGAEYARALEGAGVPLQ